jgi:hypothetical protein
MTNVIFGDAWQSIPSIRTQRFCKITCCSIRHHAVGFPSITKANTSSYSPEALHEMDTGWMEAEILDICYWLD